MNALLRVGLALTFALPTAFAAELKQATVTQTFNDVRLIEPNQADKPAASGAVIAGQRGVQTGTQSRAELEFQDRTLTRLGANTIFSFEGGTRSMEMQQGTMLLQVPKNAGGAKIRTAAVTAAITGTTILLEYTPDSEVIENGVKKKKKGKIKVIVLEGTLKLSLNNGSGQSVSLSGGQMLVCDPNTVSLPGAGAEVDLQRLTGSSLLANNAFWGREAALAAGQSPAQAEAAARAGAGLTQGRLSMDLINVEIQRQQDALRAGTLSPARENFTPLGNEIMLASLTDVISAIDVATEAAGESAVAENGKFGALPPVTPGEFVLDGTSVVQLDPVATTGANSVQGRIYRGSGFDGTPTAFAFGSAPSAFEASLGLATDTFFGSGIFPTPGVTFFKFETLRLAGTPTFTINGGPTALALIGQNGITTATTGSIDFSPLSGVLLATQAGNLTLQGGFSVTGGAGDQLALYARGGSSDLSIGAQVTGFAAVRAAAEHDVLLNGGSRIAASTRADLLAGHNLIFSGQLAAPTATLTAQSGMLALTSSGLDTAVILDLTATAPAIQLTGSLNAGATASQLRFNAGAGGFNAASFTLTGTNRQISVTVTGGGGFTAAAFTGNALTLSGGGTINVVGALNVNTLSFDGAISAGSIVATTVNATNATIGAGLTAGTVNVGGSLSLNGGGSGAFVVPAGTTLAFGGSQSFDLTSVSGAGAVLFAGTGLRSVGPYDVSGLTTIAGGQVRFGTTATLGALTLSGGGFDGSGNVRVNGPFLWTGGSISGLGQLDFFGDATISGASFKGVNRILNLRGLTVLSGASLTGAPPGLVRNFGDFRFTDNAGVSLGFTNLGTATKSGAGTTSDLAFLSNTGTVAVASGTLRVNGGQTSAGLMTVAGGAVLELNLFTLQGGGLTGPGTLRLSNFTASGGSVAFAGLTELVAGNSTFDIGAALVDVNLAGGTLSGSGFVRSTGLLNWTAGTMAGTGITSADSVLTLSGPATKSLAAQRTLVANGATTMSGGNLDFSGNAQFLNQGTFSVTDAASFTGTSTDGFINSAGATFTKSGTGTTTGVTVPFANLGTLRVTGGTLAFQSTFAQSSGSTTLLGGNLSTTGTLAFNAGLLAGSGSITGNVSSAAALTPSIGAGATGLAISGNLSLLTGSTLNFTLGGLTQGSGYGFLSTGSASLGGALVLSFANGFGGTVTNADSFTLLTSTSPLVGSFTNVGSLGRLLTADGLGSFAVDYRGSALVLSGFLAAGSTADAIFLGGTDVWSNGASWSTNPMIPQNGAFGLNYNAIINSGILDQDIASGVTIQRLTMTGGVLQLSHPLTLNAGLTFSGNGSINNGTLNLAAGSTSTQSAPLNGSSLIINNAGTYTIGDLGGAVTHPGNAVFHNTGTLNVGASSFTLLTAGLDNTGTVNVVAGQLILGLGITNTGTFNLAAGTTLVMGSVSSFDDGTTFSGAGEVLLADSTRTRFGGTINNATTIRLTPTSGFTELELKLDTAFNGPAAIVLSNDSRVRGAGTLTLAGGSITGFTTGLGSLGGDEIGLVVGPGATVNANVNGQTLKVDAGAPGVVNAGILQASNGGFLQLSGAGASAGGAIIDNSAGQIVAGSGSQVRLSDGVVLFGGTLSGAGFFSNLNAATLHDLTLSNSFISLNGSTTTLVGTITLNGGMSFNAGAAATDVVLSGDVVLGGFSSSGMLLGNHTRVRGAVGGEILTNDNLIRGESTNGGSLGSDSIGIINFGIIRAGSFGRFLLVDPDAAHGLVNPGVMEGDAQGLLRLTGSGGGDFDNTNGFIQAQHQSEVQFTQGARIVGGTLRAFGSGVLRVLDSATFENITLGAAAPLLLNDGAAATLAGAFVNGGVLSLASTGTLTELLIDGTVTLSGGGTISLTNASRVRAFAVGALLVNVDNRIQGSSNAGSVGNGDVDIVNQAAGVIDANVTGTVLTVHSGPGGLSNAGTLRATNGAQLTLVGGPVTNTGAVTVDPGSSVQVNAPMTSSGTVNVGSGGFAVGGPGVTFTQTSGTFGIAGGTVSSTASMVFNGGTLTGYGTFNAPVTNAATIQPAIGAGSTGLAFGSLLLQGTSRLEFTLGGLVQGSGYSFVSASGSVVLGGQIVISFANGLQGTISAGDTFTILTAGSLSGAFSTPIPGGRIFTADGTGSFLFSASGNQIVLSGFATAAVVTATYLGGVNNWSTVTAWSSNPNVPNNGNGGNTFDVVINSGTVTQDIAAGVTIQKLTLPSGTLTLAQPLTANALFSWSGGLINGTSTLTLNGGLTLTGNAFKDLSGGVTLVNALGSTATDDATSLAALRLAGTSTFRNDGTFLAQNDRGIAAGGGTPTFLNAGTFTRDTATGIYGVNVTFNNAGVVNVNSGTLRLDSGGTQNGTFNIAAGAFLTLNGGSTLLATGTNVAGAGTFSITNGTVIVANPLAVSPALLRLTGGTLSVGAAFTQNGAFEFGGGILTGSSPFTVTGGLTFSGSPFKELQGGTLINAAGSTAVDGAASTAALRLTLTGTVFQNDGNFFAQNDRGIATGGGTTTVVNNGAFVRDTSSGTYSIAPAFNNTGAITVNSGTLNFSGGGTQGGSLTVSNGTTLSFSGGTTNMVTGASTSGLGTVAVTGGTVAVVNDVIFTSSLLRLSGGTLSLGTGVTLQQTNNFEFSGGILTGPGLLLVQGGLILNGSPFKDVQGGTTIFAAAGSSNVDGPGNLGALRLGIGTTFRNDGIFRAQNNLGIATGGGTPLVINNGTFTRDIATGIYAVGPAFNNAGTVNSNSGTLRFDGGGTHSGSFVANPGATIAFNTGATSFVTGATTSGAGTIAFTAGTASIANNLTFASARLRLSGGTTTLGSGVTFTQTGLFELAGGILNGTGTFIAAGGIDFSGSPFKELQGGAVLVNAAGATATDTTASTGALRLTGTGTTFRNDGTFLAQNNLGIAAGGGTPGVVNNGTFTRDTATGTYSIGVAFSNTGTVNANSGVLSFASFSQTTGTTSLGGGSLAGSAPLSFGNGGLLTGFGSINAALQNAGIFRPGIGAGSTGFAVAGNVTLLSSSVLDFRLGGLTQGSGYGFIGVTGSAALGGNLVLTFANGFEGSVTGGNTFTLLTASAGFSGSFVNIASGGRLNTTDGFGSFLVTYATGSLTLSNFIAAGGALPASWTGTTGNWSSPANWSTNPNFPNNGQPGAADLYDVTLANSGSITLDVPITIQNFNFSNGTVTGASSLTVSQALNWSGGAFNGLGGVLNTLGPAHLSGTTKTFSERTWNLSGTTTWTAGNLNTGQGAVFNNLAGAVFDFAGDVSIFNNLGGTQAIFNNAGTVTRSAATLSSISATFNNSGSVTVNVGTLQLTGGGASTGSFSIAGGAALEFAGGTHNLNPGSSVTGAGTLSVSSGTLSFNAGTFNLSGTTVLSGGALDINAGATTTGLTLSGGTLGGTGTLTVSGPATWSGSTLANGGITAFNGSLLINGSTHTLAQRTLNLASTTTWTAGGLSTGLGAIINNLAGATFSTNFDGVISFNQGGPALVFNNAGLVTKTGGTGSTQLGVVFNNSGSLSVTSGTLELNLGGTGSGATYSAGAGSTLRFAGGTHDLVSASVGGPGTIEISAGTVNFNAGSFSPSGTTALTGGVLQLNAAASTSAFNLTGGTLSGNAAFSVSGPANWTGGTLSGPGATTFGGPLIVAGAVHTVSSRIVNLGGTTVWSAGGFNTGQGAVFNNLAGTDFSTSFDGALAFNLGGTLTAFNNAGTFRKTGGTGSTLMGAFFANTGSVIVQSGKLDFFAGGTGGGSYFSQVGTILEFSGGNQTFGAGTSVGGAGTTRVSGGTVDFNAGTWNGTGTTELVGGALNLNAAASTGGFNLTGGTLGGTGSFTVAGSAVWSGGTMTGSGSTTFNGALDIVLASHTLAFRTLNLAATTTWSAGGISSGQGAVINNLASAFFDTNFDGALAFNQGGAILVFNNAGTLSKSGGTGSTQINAVVNNSGLVAVTSGTLELVAGGTHSGAFNVTGAATLRFGGGTHDLNAGTAVAGAGTLSVGAGTVNFNAGTFAPSGLSLTAGTLNLNAGASTTTFALANGTLGGTAALTVGGPATITGGSFTGSGSTTFSGPLALTAGTTSLTFRTLNLAGPTMWTGGGVNWGQAAVLNVLAGAGFDTNFDGAISFNLAGATPTFSNAGTFTKSGGAGVTQIGGAFNNSGNINANSGTIAFVGNFTQTAGTTTLAGGGITGATPLNFSGGTLTGAGSIGIGLMMNGILRPALSGTGLTVNGAVSLLAGSQVQLQLGGLTQGSQYGFVAVNGVVSLGGQLVLSFANGFQASVSGTDTFTVLTATSGFGGAFANVANGGRLTTSDGFGSFLVSYSGSALTLSNFLPPGTPVATWDGTNNPWSSVTHWSTNPAFPNGSFDAVVNAGTVVLDGNYSVLKFDLGGTASIFAGSPQTLTVNQLFTWTGGTLSGLVLNANGGALLNGSAALALNNATLTVPAGQTLTDSGAHAFSVGNGSTITNAGTWLANNDNGLASGGGSNVFTNTGTLTRGAGTGEYSLTPFLNNTGTVNVNTGSLSLRGGGGGNGTFVVANLANLAFLSNYTFGTGGISGPGGGVISLGNSAIISVPSSVTFGSVQLDLGAATLSVSAGQTLTLNGPFSFSAGTIAGGGIVRMTGGGFLAGFANMTMDNAQLNNAGGSTFTDGPGNTRPLIFANGAVFNNQGTYLASNDGVLLVSGSGTFANAGTFTRGTSTGAYTVNPAFNHTGTVNVNSGTLLLAGGGTSSGTFNIAAGSTLSLTGGYSFTVGAAVAGAGTLGFGGGTVTIVDNLNSGAATLTLSAGTLTINSGRTLNQAGLFNFAGGTLNGPGNFFANGGLNFGGTTQAIIAGPLFNVGGQVAVDPASSTGGVAMGTGGLFTNAGSFLAQNNLGISTAAGTPAINNTGTFTRNTGTGTYSIAPTFTNSGTVAVNSGTLRFTGTYTQSGGSTLVTGGTLATAGFFDIQSGLLTGYGNITGDVSSAGTLRPAIGGPGRLNISGVLTLQAGNLLQMQIGGLTQGTQYSSLAVGGGTILAGNLVLSFANGFQGSVTPADTFTLLTTGTNFIGNFVNASNGTRLNTSDGFGSFLVSLTSNTLSLSNFLTSSTVFWTGTVGNWSAPGNWSAAVPNSSLTDVAIDAGRSGTNSIVTVDGSFAARNLTIDAGDTLIVGAGSGLTLNGTFTNNGQVTVNGAGGSSLAFTGGIILGGIGTITLSGPGASLIAPAGIINGATHAVIGTGSVTGPFTNRGLVQANGGTLTFNNGFVQDGASGTLNLAGGTLSAPSPFQVNAGAVTGRGTIASGLGVATGGTVNAGGGILTISGGVFTLNTGGTLITTLNGTVQATQYSFITALAGTNLAGSLAVNFGGTFGSTVQNSNTFTFLSSNTFPAGNFSNVAFGGRLATVDGLGTFLVDRSGNSLVLSDFLYNVTAPTGANWLNATSGTYTTGANWSGGAVPNDLTAPAGTGYNVNVTVAGTPYTISLGSAVTVQSLTLNSASATLALNPGATLRVLNGLTLQSGTLSLDGATLKGLGGSGPLSLLSLTGGSLAFSSSGANRVDALQLNGNFSIATSNGTARLVNGTQIAGTVNLSGNGATLALETSQTYSGLTANLGTATTPGHLSVESSNTVVFDNSVVVRGTGTVGSARLLGGSQTLTNQGSITADVSGQPLAINPSSAFLNQGNIGATGGGLLTIGAGGSSTVTNTGTITANNATVNLFADFTGSGVGTLNATNSVVQLSGSFRTVGLAGISRTGGSLLLLNGGQLDNGGGTFTLTPALGTLTLNGGRFFGGTVDNTGGDALAFGNITTSRLDGVQVLGGLNLNTTSAFVRLQNGSTLAGVVNITGAAANLGYEQSGTVTGVTFNLGTGGSLGNLTIEGNNTLTLGAGVVVRGAGSLGRSLLAAATSNLVNQGTVTADVSGQTLMITPTTFANSGTVQVQGGASLTIGNGLATAVSNTGTFGANNGTLTLAGDFTGSGIGTLTAANSTVNLNGSFRTAGLAGISTTGGTLQLSGTLDNAGDTLAFLPARGPITLAGGRVVGGTIDNTGGQALTFSSSSNNRLEGVTFAGSLDLTTANAGVRLLAGSTPPATVNLTGANTVFSLGESATININVNLDAPGGAGNFSVDGAGTAITLGPSAFVRGAGIVGIQNYIGGGNSITNQGLIVADRAGFVLDLRGTTFVNDVGGQFQVLNGAILQLSTNVNSTAGLISVLNGTLTLGGTTLNTQFLNGGIGTVNLNGAGASLVLPMGIGFRVPTAGPSNGGTLTLNSQLGVNITPAAINGIDVTGEDDIFDNFDGGHGGTVTVTASNGDINVDSPIDASTGRNQVSSPTGGNGGSVTLNATGTVNVRSTIRVSSDTAPRASSRGGNISVNSSRSGGTAINITNTAQLHALLSAAAPGPGGTINIVASGSNSNVAVAGSVRADRGSVTVRHNAAGGTVNVASTAALRGDIVKIGALGNNGILTIAGGDFNGDTTIRLYATGSNGQVLFTGNTTLQGTSVKQIAAQTVTIQNGVQVNVLGPAPAQVFTNVPNFTGSGGNGSTTGTFTGQGATTSPLSGAPGF